MADSFLFQYLFMYLFYLFVNVYISVSIVSRSQRVSLIVIRFCLSVCLSVGHSATYSLPQLIDHNQIWSSDPCKDFWIPYLPYFRCQREKYAKFLLFPTAAL